MVCTDDVTFDVCLCLLLDVSGMVHYYMNAYCSVLCIYCAPTWTLCRYGCICAHVHIILYYCILLIILQDVASV